MIALIDYGAGNLRSVEFALEALRVRYERVSDAAGLDRAAAVILPGVGAAASAVRELTERGLFEPLRHCAVPILGVCLGMQLLTEYSDEGGVETECLGLIPGRTQRFAPGLRLPQIGWNLVELSDDPLFDGFPYEDYFYFLHSQRVHCRESFVIGQATYGSPFPAAIRFRNAAGVQFHPEKSAAAGLRVLKNFCRTLDGPC